MSDAAYNAIKARLNMINTTFFHSAVRSKLTGKDPSDTLTIPGVTSVTTVYGRVKNGTVYTSVTPSSLSNTDNIPGATDITYQTELNFTGTNNSLYSSLDNTTPFGVSITKENGFDALRTVGYIAKNFGAFVNSTSGNPLTVPKYEIDATTLKTKTRTVYNDTATGIKSGDNPDNIANNIPLLFDFKKISGEDTDSKDKLSQTNLFTLQCMTVFWERYHTILAAWNNWKNYLDAKDTTRATDAKKILDYLYTQIQWENKTAKQSISETGASYVLTYETNLSTINNLNENLKTGKSNLRDNISMVGGNKKQASTAGIIEYVAAAIVLATFISIIVIFSIPMEQERRIPVIATLFAVSVVLSIIIYFVRGIGGANREGFATVGANREGFEAVSPVLGQGTANYAPTAVSTLTAADNYQAAILQELGESLNNIIIMSLALNNIQLYGNINYTLAKEIDYYSNQQSQITNTTDRMLFMARIMNLDRQTSQARISFYIAMTILLATGAFLLVFFDNFPAVKTTVMVVFGLLIVIALFIYILEVSARVRTDGSKIYWGKPVVALKGVSGAA